MKITAFTLLFAVFTTAAPVPLEAESLSSTTLTGRDGTTEFDPDLGFKAKRDGTTEFDPDLGFKARRDGTTEFDPDLGFKAKRDGTTEFDPDLGF